METLLREPPLGQDLDSHQPPPQVQYCFISSFDRLSTGQKLTILLTNRDGDELATSVFPAALQTYSAFRLELARNHIAFKNSYFESGRGRFRRWTHVIDRLLAGKPSRRNKRDHRRRGGR